MGIPGLTSYISNNSDRYLENYALHDTYLVIDGNNIGCQLYNWHTNLTNCVFGGDYDRYARCVANFFDELLKCNITPLVIFDGGCEDKKLKTIISRTKEKIQAASHFTPVYQSRNKFLPLFLKDVFKDVMSQKGIKCAQCIFEADNVIAAIARILNCPVLSYDSDFYIYGTLYIPFNTWGNSIVRKPFGNGYVKHCKIYYVEKLFRDYRGLNQSLLPLVAILLGNDYTKTNVFKNFFRHLKLRKTGRKFNDQQRRIDATFNWLRTHSLNQAIISILSRSCKQERKHILNIIELIINSYTDACESLSILALLGIPENFLKANKQIASNKTYKFEGDIYNLTYIEEKPDEADLSDSNEIDDKEITSIVQETQLISNETSVNNLPQWFIDEFKQGKYPSYFIDIIVRKLYVCPVQVEEYVSTSSIITSLKIVSVIYALLILEINKKRTNLHYMTREENKVKRYQLEFNDTMFACKLPSLSNLRDVPIIIRKEILNNTLGICDESYMNQLPSVWKLYIATIKYWIDQHQESPKLNCHVYSFLLAMLFNIIDCKIGFYRVLHNFQRRFSKTMQDILSRRKMLNHRPDYSNFTLLNIFHQIDADDCLIAASFFISNFETDPKLYIHPKKFNISIVHGFAEFQFCLRHSLHLNSLLGYPYEPSNIANLFNGTLLYNLCTNFMKRNDIESYINSILQKSPSLLHLFHQLLLIVKPLFNMTQVEKVNKCKKQKTKNERKEDCEQNHEEETIQDEGTSETSFYDANNPFSLLDNTQ